MKVKYQANTMQEALDKVKNELGPDAVIVSSQQVKSKKGIFGFFSPKIYEVIAMVDPSSPTKKDAPKTRPFPAMQKPNREAARRAKENKLDQMVEKALLWEKDKDKQKEQETLKGIDDKIDKLNDMIDQFSTKVATVQKNNEIEMSPELQKLYDNLVNADTHEEVALELINRVQAILDRKTDVSPMEAMDHVLREFIGQVEEIGHKKFEQQVVMLIGPTGVGKTTTLVKLASYFVTKLHLKIGIINTDVYRVGAQEQLKTYAEILDVPMQTVYKPEDIPAAMEEFCELDLIFIDTAGKVSDDKEYQAEVEKIIQLAGVDQIYLAVSGSTQLRNLKELFDNYAFLGKHRIIVTKMDEGSRKGVFLNIRQFSGRPLSYETIGQSVPDDIQKADVAAIISEVLRY